MADIVHYIFRKELASKSPSSPTLDHWARSDDGTAWIRVHNEPRDIDYSVHDDCTLPFDSKHVEFVTVERDYINGEHTSSVVPMTPIGNVPISTMPWTGRTKYHLRRIDNAAPMSVISTSEELQSSDTFVDYPVMPVQDYVPEHRDKVQGGIQWSAM
eukprot:1035464-Amphidinium_carterae.1